MGWPSLTPATKTGRKCRKSLACNKDQWRRYNRVNLKVPTALEKSTTQSFILKTERSSAYWELVEFNSTPKFQCSLHCVCFDAYSLLGAFLPVFVSWVEFTHPGLPPTGVVSLSGELKTRLLINSPPISLLAALCQHFLWRNNLNDPGSREFTLLCAGVSSCVLDCVRVCMCEHNMSTLSCLNLCVRVKTICKFPGVLIFAEGLIPNETAATALFLVPTNPHHCRQLANSGALTADQMFHCCKYSLHI